MSNPRNFLVLVAGSLLLLSACNSGGSSGVENMGDLWGGPMDSVAPKPRYSVTDVSITVAGSQAAGRVSSLTMVPQVFTGSFSDVTRVNVVVSGEDKFGVTQTSLASVDLTLSAGVWSGTISGLAVGPTLTFTASGYNSGGTVIFSGVATQVLTGVSDAVAVNMTPNDNSVPVAFPIITSITVPAETVVSTTTAGNAIAVAVTSSANDTLTYGFTAATGGGSFGTPTGTLVLPGSGTGTINTAYTAPATPNGTAGYVHTVSVANAQGNSVDATFATVVVYSVTTPTVTAYFAPVVTAIKGKRAGTNVTWTATVTDDKSLAALSYTWSYVSTAGAAALSSTVNPATMTGYTPAATGTITLAVKDGDNLTTTIHFTLPAGQFPNGVGVGN